MKTKPTDHVIAVYKDGKTTFHYVRNQKEEDALSGRVIGKIESKKYFGKEEKLFQEAMKLKVETEK